jgi:hypothetical protein
VPRYLWVCRVRCTPPSRRAEGAIAPSRGDSTAAAPSEDVTHSTVRRSRSTYQPGDGSPTPRRPRRKRGKHCPYLRRRRKNRVSSESETSQRQRLLAPTINHFAVRATLLHLGMSQADIVRVMGVQSQVNATDDESADVVLRYSAEPIAATVTISEGKLSGVALDVAGVDDPAFPKFARAAWLVDPTVVSARLWKTPSHHCAPTVIATDQRSSLADIGRGSRKSSPTPRRDERRTNDIRATG